MGQQGSRPDVNVHVLRHRRAEFRVSQHLAKFDHFDTDQRRFSRKMYNYTHMYICAMALVLSFSDLPGVTNSGSSCSCIPFTILSCRSSQMMCLSKFFAFQRVILEQRQKKTLGGFQSMQGTPNQVVDDQFSLETTMMTTGDPPFLGNLPRLFFEQLPDTLALVLV